MNYLPARHYDFCKNIHVNDFLTFSFLILTSLTGLCQDSLLFHHGKAITSVSDWENLRKPEIKNLVLENVYGFLPEPAEWDSKVVKEVMLNDRSTHYKEVEIQLFKEHLPTRSIRLSIFLPANQSKPAPVVLALNKCGNIEVVPTEDVGARDDRTLHPKCLKTIEHKDGTIESLRGSQKNFWAIDSMLKRGYAFATFHESDIVADINNIDQGIFPFYPELKCDTGWKIISAWAWGLQRAIDYLVSDDQIDPTRIILFGHSRRGKAALLAAALDERVDMVVPHQTGTGGMALSKKHPMESIRRINRTFPFWFNDKFKTYSGKPKTLPLDQHYLLALIAPRPVIETVGKRDLWSSYWLSLKTLKLVSSVYELYGMQGLSGNGKISKGSDFKNNQGTIVQVRRPYPHTMNGDYWNFILDFADLKLK